MNKFEQVSGDDHQVSVARGGYTEMNKFEQVSSDDHQISVVGKGLGDGYPRPHVQGRGWVSQVPCPGGEVYPTI